jgi:hypothetical protein
MLRKGSCGLIITQYHERKKDKCRFPHPSLPTPFQRRGKRRGREGDENSPKVKDFCWLHLFSKLKR